MKNNSAVIFPDTVPAVQVLVPLVPVFEQVVYCQPIENDDSGIPEDPFVKDMIERSCCRIHFPAPLSGERERFLSLVNDLHRRRDDYAAQLTHVSLASISSGSQTKTESRSSILSTLLAGHGIDSAQKELREKVLWQARLVLKLGEQFDADQKSVAEEMQSMRDRERDLFAGLSGSGSMFRLTEKLNSPVADPERMQRLRLKAWARLVAFGSFATEGRVFVSTDPDAVDRLSEEYERRTGSRPAEIGSLFLPAYCSDQEGFHEQLLKFRRSSQQLFSDPFTISGEQLQTLNESLDSCFPEIDCGRCQLVLYKFSRVKILELFLDSFGHDEDDLQAELADEAPRDVVAGLLMPQ